MTPTAASGPKDIATLWSMLFALIDDLVRLMAPAGSGQIPVPLALAADARMALRKAEGVLRRALMPAAEAMIASLPPRRVARPRLPSRPVPAPGSIPFVFRLHEPARAPQSPGQSSPHSPHPGDHFGTARVAITNEVRRLAALVATASAPARATRRLALILRRRRAEGQSQLPWSTDWQADPRPCPPCADIIRSTDPPDQVPEDHPP